MKRTAVLYSHHIGRMIKRHWFLQGKIKVVHTGTEELLKSQGHEVIDINQFLYPPKPKEKFEYVGLYDKELPLDKNHPDFKSEPCYFYRDENLLLEGLPQAKVLTNTVEITEGLPQVFIEKENSLNLSNEIHSEVKKKILLSCVFEATQQKLPPRKDPLRPAWNFPRDYGIPDTRRNELLSKNLLNICEQHTNIKDKSVLVDILFTAPFKAHNKNIQFEMTSELVVTSKKKLSPVADATATHTIPLPDLHPVDCTVSLNPSNFYTMQDIYPINIKSKWPYIQMGFVHFNETQVKNIFQEEITESQIYARSLLKGFSLAVSQARAMYGNDVKQLPEPVVVPVVQTDSRMFHFTVFQLNTLELDNKSDTKNIFWHSPGILLYSSCKYKEGRPNLENYNPDVVKKLFTFFNIE